MAKQVIVDFTVKTGTAVREVKDLKEEIQNVNKEAVKTTNQTSTGLNKVGKSTNKASGGFMKMGSALKGLGIGLIVAAFAKFTEVLNQNQKVTDFFNTTFETLSLAFNDFFNFLFNNVGGVVDTFKSIFENPGKSIKELGTAIKNNLIERFNSFLDTLGFVASAVKKVFSGDFKGALEDVKSAGKESIDVLTGVDNTFDKTVETVTKVAEATKNYVVETVSAAKANVDLGKQAEIARVRQQGIIESFDLQAEKLRQVRDEERNTIEERIAANNRLKETLDEQEVAMLKQVDLQIAAAQAEFNKNQNQENTIALLEAQQEKEAVLAQIAGFRSEQLSNDLALNREKLELENSIIDAESERSINQKQFLAEEIEGDVLRLEALKLAAEEEAKIEEQRLKTKRDLFQEGTQAFADANNELLDFQQENAQEQIKIEKDLGKAKVQQTSAALSALATIVGKNSKFGKAIAVVQAIRDTFAAANTALKSAPPPFNFIQAAAVVAAGIANVKSITATKEPSPPSGLGVGSSGGGVSVPTPQAPSFNIVGASAENQLAQTLADATQKPIKAFVVAGDVSTAQSLDRNIIQESSLG
jgi:hypothetical protein